MLIGAGRDRRVTIPRSDEARNDDDGNAHRLGIFLQRTNRIPPTRSWHRHVHEDQARPLAPNDGDRFFTIARFQYSIPRALENRDIERSLLGAVFGDKNRRKEWRWPYR